MSGRRKLLGIDPGSAKCGFAVVFDDGTRDAIDVVPAGEIEVRVEAELRSGPVAAICIGDATGSAAIVALCRRRWPEIPRPIVDETNTTYEARALYYADHPPRGLLRFVPRGLLVPSDPLDGYAAALIVARYLRSQERPESGIKTGPGVHPVEGSILHRRDALE